MVYANRALQLTDLGRAEVQAWRDHLARQAAMRFLFAPLPWDKDAHSKRTALPTRSARKPAQKAA